VTGQRFIIGILVMGIAVPLTLFFLLDLHALSQLFTIAAVTFVSWGVSDLLATILAKPRLQGKSPGKAIKEDWERRSGE
jgi:hypothetical protein